MNNKNTPDINIILIDFLKSIEKVKPKLIITDELKSTFKQIAKTLKVVSQNKFEIKIDVEALKAVGIKISEYHENVSEHTLLVSRHGWFIDLIAPIDLPVNAYNFFNSGKIKDGDRIIGDYYNEYIEDVFDILKKRHKRRKLILDDILTGYKKKNYRLIIPCIFTQIDGICNDFTKNAFFIKSPKNNHLPKITPLIEAETEGFLKFYISPLQNQTPIMVHEKYLNDFPCKFNRHQVIHGSSVSYGNKTNCLKAISFLKYLSDILSVLEQRKPKV